MSQSGSRILDPVFKGGGAASPKRKVDRLVLAPSLNGVGPSFMNSVAGFYM